MPTNLSTKAYDTSTYQPVPEDNKNTAVSAIDVILNAMPSVSDKIKKQHLLNGMLWLYTEGAGQRQKWKCRYRSEQVLNRDKEVDIQHEHLHTRSYIKEELLSGRVTDIKSFLEENCIGCLVSKEEHKKFGSRESGWGKYARNGIRIFDIVEKKWLDGSSLAVNSSGDFTSDVAEQPVTKKTLFPNTYILRNYLTQEVEQLLVRSEMEQIVSILPKKKKIGSKCHAQLMISKGRPELKRFDRPPNIQIFNNGRNDFGNMIHDFDEDYYSEVVGENENQIIVENLKYAESQIRYLRELLD
ncbi:hypothetical protein ACFS7Z_08480 [Pontibacter toksunensis]|uniref:Uncharacterized protein n=1 Tax=Pontibacter toksunensis TaxID=1332631 RepID=A0ABW6BS82_9BACT